MLVLPTDLPLRFLVGLNSVYLDCTVPGVQLLVEKAPPMLVVGMVQERNLLFEENLVIQGPR